MSSLSDEFALIAEQAGVLADRATELDDAGLSLLEETAKSIGKAWSQSSLGYQANVYYKDFLVPPAGHIFSREWGFLGMFHGTVGEWERHSPDEVVALVHSRAGDVDLEPVRHASEAVRAAAQELIEKARSAGARIPLPYDAYLTERLEGLAHIALPSVRTLQRSLMNVPQGNVPVRDMQAYEGGWQVAGHQLVLGEMAYIRSPYQVAIDLAEACRAIAAHLEAKESSAGPLLVQTGSKVFIGHGGGSKEYLALGVWLADEGLDWEVFDREPTAGLSTKERLSEMLDRAQVAFLIMTAEDETSDGSMRARENVVHEVGLFQGRLGFTKAIVLLEEGCSEFSNIFGLGQIRFPRGNIRGAFDEIRQVLRREGVLP
jgi:predicted nucleotide-binding protein